MGSAEGKSQEDAWGLLASLSNRIGELLSQTIKGRVLRRIPSVNFNSIHTYVPTHMHAHTNTENHYPVIQYGEADLTSPQVQKPLCGHAVLLWEKEMGPCSR